MKHRTFRSSLIVYRFFFFALTSSIIFLHGCSKSSSSHDNESKDSLCQQFADSGKLAGVFGGGPIYKARSITISELKASGFTEVVVWNIFVNNAGDLNFNSEFPLVADGEYIGDLKYPDFAADMTLLKESPTCVQRVTFSIGSSVVGVFQAIRDLINAEGTGETSTLYKNFKTLKTAIPAIDAIDLDDENCYDIQTMVSFCIMLGKLGYKVVLDPYTNQAFWKNVAYQVNNQLPGTIDGVHLQCYAGGGGNNPCTGWDFGDTPVYAGVWDRDLTPVQVQSQMTDWRNTCELKGGWMWLYDDFYGTTETTLYADAIINALK